MRIAFVVVFILLLSNINQVVCAQAVQPINGHSNAKTELAGGDHVYDVNGQSALVLSGAAGTIGFKNIDGQSYVDLSRLNAQRIVIDRLNGQTLVFLRGCNIQLPEIDGQCSVFVTILPGGSLNCGKLNGGSRVFWRKSHPTDAAIHVPVPQLDGNSRFEEREFPTCF